MIKMDFYKKIINNLKVYDTKLLLDILIVLKYIFTGVFCIMI